MRPMKLADSGHLSQVLRIASLASLSISGGPSLAQVVVNGEPVDHAELSSPKIDKGATIYVQEFSTSSANLGKAKHRATAERVVSVMPHLLAVDLVESLRDSGFDAQFYSDGSTSRDSMMLSGRFTELDPGSRTARVWLGFGAGQSKVCVDGTVVREGATIGRFSHCRSGIGRGGSDPPVNGNADRIARRVADLFTKWAGGQL
jgi:hypothetical protein